MGEKRKLIEVALPRDAINKESAQQKSIRHGHPSTLYLWWAQRPLAAARAVLFAQRGLEDRSMYYFDDTPGSGSIDIRYLGRHLRGLQTSRS